MNGKMYNRLLTILLFSCMLALFKPVLSQAQNVELDYTRKGITPIFIMPEFSDYPDEFDSPKEAFKAAFKQMELPEKVDDNRIQDCIIVDEDLSPSLDFVFGEGYKHDHVQEVLKEKNTVRQVIDTIFDADKEGRYSMNELINRVKYDLSDREVRRLKNTAKGFDQGARDVKWINKILKSNYIFAFRFKHIKSAETMREEGNTRIEEDDTGYSAKGHVFIYRVDMNDTIRNKFFNRCWAGENSSEKELQEALKARKNMEFDFDYVDQTQFGNQKPRQSLGKMVEKDTLSKKDKFLRIPQLSFYNAKWNFENKMNVTGETERFDQVKTSVFKTGYFPFFYGYSKIGTKEGLKPDDRFYVYENVMVDGEEQQKLRGVLRATSNITENDTISSGDMEPSRFVQTYGKPLGKGMLVKQNKGGVIGLSLGWLYHGRHYLNGQWELRLSDLFSFSNGIYFYQDIGYATENFSSDEEDIYHTELGLSKMLYIMRDLHLSPYAGLKVAPNFTYDLGVRLDLNLNHWLKLRTSFGHAPIDYSQDDGRERLLNNFSSDFPSKWSVMLRAKF